ncbi:hypothetical protein AB0L71_05600 [Streptomyces sp. NPDC052052]|uniref:hypothetical protein n=1 Tax=Streptomyces sp. NPDC052052 TaxID=3154756 RepID=UPI003448E24F
MSDGIEWIDAELGDGGFSLIMVKGISHEELAVYLGAQPGTLMDPGIAHEMLKLSHGSGSRDLPAYAMLGEADNGWAFAIESPDAGDRNYRLAPGRDLWSRHTAVSVLDTTMDPPVISVGVDGDRDWMFWEYTTDKTDHPLTRRLVAEGGFVERPDRVHRDDAADDVTMSDVYRVMGEYYGLTLPRQAIVDGRLPHAFTEPRTLVHPCARCPVCGDKRMLPYGGGSWGLGEHRLVCIYYKVRDIPGYPPQGCPGEISGPALAEAVREEPNPKYDNIRMPRDV